MNLTGLREKLSKKAIFETTVDELRYQIETNYGSATDSEKKEVFEIVSRVGTLLQTRYTSSLYWKRGLQVFIALERESTDISEIRKLKSLISKAGEILKDADIENSIVSEGRNQYQGQNQSGQLSGSETTPQPPWLVAQRAQFSLLSEIYAEEQQEINTRPPGDPEPGIELNSSAEANGDTVVDDSTESLLEQRTSHRRRLVLALGRAHGLGAGENLNFLEILRSAMTGGGDEFPGLEEALQATMQEGSTGNPPAAKSVVESLPRAKVTEDFLRRLEGDHKCTICQESFLVSEDLKQLSCSHWYHVECIEAWLDLKNTCPLCRLELRTDDEEYEQRKVKEKEREEERRAVENSLKGNDYMFM